MVFVDLGCGCWFMVLQSFVDIKKQKRRTTSINRGSSSRREEVDEEIERCGY